MNNELKIALWTLVILHVFVKCSHVIDKQSQQRLYASDYCESLGVCPEGTHVLCTHYNPNRTKGPLCTGTKNVSMTPEYAENILDLLNLIRGRSALGKTTGLANLTLPRAYGMYRLQWDPELSTLAQVWANTCIVSLDVCRATKRFPDPTQLAGLTRFDANWIPINARKLFNYNGFSLDKVKYGIHSVMRSWYRTKEYIHPDDITQVNDIWPKYLGTNVFMQIVHGRATHAGCGLSIFKEYSYDVSSEHKIELIHNVVRVVCNLSSRLLVEPRKDRVYTTEPPTQVGYTLRCGCPLGFDEDDYCLCYESGRKLPASCKDKECKPAVVVLPIFTLEKAPPSKLNVEHRKDERRNRKGTNDTDLDHLDNTYSRRHDLRGSVFLQSSVFELHPRKLKSERIVTKLLKKDVKPRRDFSNVRKLMSKYLNIRRSTNFTKPKIINGVKGFTTSPPSKYDNINHINKTKIENFIEPTRRRMVNDNVILENMNDNLNFSKGVTNNKLMILLNKLEEEAKNVQLDSDKKNVLDHKIRKIYSTFVEKAFLPRKDWNNNELTAKNTSFDVFLENDRLHKFEEQFNTLKEYDPDHIHNNNHMINNHLIKNSNKNFMKLTRIGDNFKDYSFTNNSNDKLRGTRNIHRISSNQYSKVDETNNYKQNNSLLRQEDDLLTLEKRQFYQNKLNNLKRKFKDFRNQGNRQNEHADQHNMRRMLPSYHELQLKRKKLHF